VRKRRRANLAGEAVLLVLAAASVVEAVRGGFLAEGFALALTLQNRAARSPSRPCRRSWRARWASWA
jgi:hypothetical protein